METPIAWKSDDTTLVQALSDGITHGAWPWLPVQRGYWGEPEGYLKPTERV
jgi:hypothetical protein